jgi:hypothetical protein
MATEMMDDKLAVEAFVADFEKVFLQGDRYLENEVKSRLRRWVAKNWRTSKKFLSQLTGELRRAGVAESDLDKILELPD